jgi:hypothetical protein
MLVQHYAATMCMMHDAETRKPKAEKEERHRHHACIDIDITGRFS